MTYNVDMLWDADEIIAEIRDVLDHEPALDARQINVTALERRIVLDGWVTDEASRVLTEKLTRAVNGVGDVENQLLVQITDVDDKPLIAPER